MRRDSFLTMVLAGGVGERLFPLTSNRCKPAVPFGANYRIVDFTLMNCVLSGCRQIHVLTQYHAQSLNRHRVERWNFLARELGEYIHLVPPKLRDAGGVYLGTADALYRNIELLERHRPSHVLILSGDHVYRADYDRLIQAHLDREADITVLTGSVPSREAASFGVVDYDRDGRIINFVEKPSDPAPYASNGRCLINLGVYCFETSFLVRLLCEDAKGNTAHDFGKNILPASLSRGDVYSCGLDVVSPDRAPYWRDVGNIDSYFEGNMDLLQLPAVFELTDPRWPEGSRFFDWVPSRFAVSTTINGRHVRGQNMLGNGVRIGDAVVVNTVLSSQVYVGSGSQLEECIVLPGATVGRDVKMRRTIVEEGMRVPDGACIGFDTENSRFPTSPGGVTVISGCCFPEAPAERRRSVVPRTEVVSAG